VRSNIFSLPESRRSGRVTASPPLQERSRVTQNRIFAALAELLAAKPFDQISVAELTERAQCSMSSLYARFPTKDTLLSAFYDRFFEFSTDQVGTALGAIRSEALPLELRVNRLIAFFVHSYRSHRGLLRSLVLYDKHYGAAQFDARTREYKHRVFEQALGLVFKGDPRSRAPDAVRSFGFTLWLVVQGIEHVVLFDDRIGSEHITDAQLTAQLTQVLLGSIAR
jgi:AcrR family transcriptional regulator